MSLSIVVASLICLRLAKRIAVVCGGLAVIALGQAEEAHWAFEPERLTYRYASRDFRLTDVHGRVIRDIIS